MPVRTGTTGTHHHVIVVFDAGQGPTTLTGGFLRFIYIYGVDYQYMSYYVDTLAVRRRGTVGTKEPGCIGQHVRRYLYTTCIG